jgi:hypothetical protein
MRRAFAMLHRGQEREAAGACKRREATAGRLAYSSLLHVSATVVLARGLLCRIVGGAS